MTDAGKDIVERLPKHVELLANTTMDITLADWGPIVNDILKAATTIEALRNENEEQARINGMGAERELALRNENASLRARVEKLEGALNYYAVNHEWPNEGPWGVDSTDFGEVARAALEGAKHA